jgi:hypothetical protein
MRLRVVILALIAAMAIVAMPAAASTPQPAFVGHRCTIRTCRYFTSSYHTARYYYDRRTCNQWKSLSRKYLRGYRTVRRLHRDFPHRRLHPPC